MPGAEIGHWKSLHAVTKTKAVAAFVGATRRVAAFGAAFGPTEWRPGIGAPGRLGDRAPAAGRAHPPWSQRALGSALGRWGLPAVSGAKCA